VSFPYGDVDLVTEICGTDYAMYAYAVYGYHLQVHVNRVHYKTVNSLILIMKETDDSETLVTL
jgi:hypothetical protein